MPDSLAHCLSIRWSPQHFAAAKNLQAGGASANMSTTGNVAKTIIEIIADANLAPKASATRIAKLAASQSGSLVAALIKELGLAEDQVAGALAKSLRLPLLDSSSVSIDAEAVRELPAQMAKRLNAIPLAVRSDVDPTVMRVAMADPSDMVAIAEMQQETGHELEPCVMSLSEIEKLIAKIYGGFSTAVIQRPGASNQRFVDNMFVTSKRKKKSAVIGILNGNLADDSQEISVTAQVTIPGTGRAETMGQIQARLPEPAGSWRELESRFRALYDVLLSKGLVTPEELAAALFELAQDEE
jgi:hypothetical protein